MEDVNLIFDNSEVEAEYLAWRRYSGDNDPLQTDETVGLLDVLRAHFLIVDYFCTESYGIGGIGPKDPELLRSAI